MLPHADLAVIAGAAYRGPWSGVAALDCEYDLLPRGEELVVAIAGTHPTALLDWLRDLHFRPRWFPLIGVCHSGFAAGGLAIARDLLPKLKGETRLISVVGHSLGGAEAEVVGAALIDAGYRVRIVTFGAPRVAFFLNFALRRLIRRAREYCRYARRGDIVPHEPPLFFGFKHLARGVALGRDYGDPIENHSVGRYAVDIRARDAHWGADVLLPAAAGATPEKGP